MDIVFAGRSKYGKLDYVCAWYQKSADLMKKNEQIRTAFVSTNSISQGESVACL